jgi:hypothetical protein
VLDKRPVFEGGIPVDADADGALFDASPMKIKSSHPGDMRPEDQHTREPDRQTGGLVVLDGEKALSTHSIDALHGSIGGADPSGQ